MNAPLSQVDRPNSYIGKSLPRPNAKRLLAGRGRFVDDIQLPRMLHAVFVRSPHAHAEIVAVHVADAQSMPGARRVVLGDEIATLCEPWTGTLRHFKGMKSPPQAPLAQDRVSWVGQPVVAILADSRAQAEDAAERVTVDYRELPAVVDYDAALAPDAVLVHDALGDNLAFTATIESGDADDAFNRADAVVDVDLSFGRHTPVTLEPRSIVADFEPGERSLTVHHSTQTPYQFQDIFARHFRLDESRVRVIAPDIGGSFGMKLHVYPEDMAVVALSMLAQRPVKYVADRGESFLNDIHLRDHRLRAELALAADGRFLGMRVRDDTAIGAYSAYPRTSAVEGNQVVRLMGAPYRITDYRADLRVIFQNKTQTSQYRGVGHPIACAASERLVDLAAQKLGLDPFEIRRRNYVTDDMYPHTTASGYRFERLSFDECLTKLHALMDYPALRAEQARLRGQGVYRGIGLATYVEITNPSPAFYGVGGAHISAQDGCVLKLTPSGEVQCAISVTEQGQGTETVIGQIVADEFGVDLARVKVLTGDTETTPHGGATWACRGAGIGGETALQAARLLKANVLKIGAAILQSAPEQLAISDGRLIDRTSGAARMPLGELAALVYFRSDTLPPNLHAGLTVAHHYAPQGYPFAFTNGIHASLVEVDAETGFIRLLKHWVVEDCGRVINPLLVEEQVRGGTVQGIGAALFEECLYGDDGQLLNGSMADYLVPMAFEMPDIVIAHVETPTKDTELGAKGCGEAGTSAASGAVLNAVNDALAPLDASISQIPMTPQRMLRALRLV
ncbi:MULTISPECIES: xanthine dehydrogenase family protein molybdopterin-binding subunit [Rhodopseudomonas]|uniref:Carbon monoxide dehydrogenase n=1 Tax=Rhodopseudomonas palustris TaxID=1076 RepID=A0A0D7EJE8_RHOPL|nr:MULTISPECIES: xanthine dehydrogenase family protein molybdopterin-binding subunit [Rhodopseudomonas]KIZ40751.1 carbon monoxide dehydrogenase [Rhodopseudomonas palustris]MDF3813746.1 xanthine dehydrogenase family protein molybdopterin-binding subunit [Rhodopseudomonas sp. BAL398]WOK17633.1 xanthine dehydrogenase family protein molybdopterin-binding subunit [Rhodopseudomonas sp. BAL398]